MRVVLFVHSILSDWNHGNAHFLRGVVRELLTRGHDVRVLEPANGWSVTNLRAEPQGPAVLADLQECLPWLSSSPYRLEELDLDTALDGADLVLMHEWTDPLIIAELGRRRAIGGRFRLLFHDTHHRCVTAPAEMARLDLSNFDGILAFGESVAERYRAMGWARRVWVWHEAADVALFRPSPHVSPEGALIFIGNWGDGERTEELQTFLLNPIRDLGVSATIHGVRYPPDGLAAVAAAGAAYQGWLPNHRVPAAFARHRVTVHVPRRPYAQALPGVPTIRVFEALACGIPLVSAPWADTEGLFRPGDYWSVPSGEAMTAALRTLLADPQQAAAQAQAGLETVLARHTCAHRVDELLAIAADLGLALPATREAA